MKADAWNYEVSLRRWRTSVMKHFPTPLMITHFWCSRVFRRHACTAIPTQSRLSERVKPAPRHMIRGPLPSFLCYFVFFLFVWLIWLLQRLWLMAAVAQHKPASASPKASKEGPVSVIDLLINEMFRFPLHFIVKCSSLATKRFITDALCRVNHCATTEPATPPGRPSQPRGKIIHLLRDLTERAMLTKNMPSCPYCVWYPYISSGSEIIHEFIFS